MLGPPTLNRPIDDSWIWKGNIPSLHGLRAFSILIVFLSHAFWGAHISDQWLPFAGTTGVAIFFVISGFLITLLLLRENKKAGKISLRNFYVRRILRIFPAYYFYLAVMCCLTLTGVLQIPLREIGFAAIYYSSLLPSSMWPSWDVAHTWSLSVEEHFYIVWPLILVLCGRRVSFLIAMSYIIATPFLRYSLANTTPYFLWAFTPTRVDAMACGCCLAIAATSPKWRPRISMTPLQCNVTLLVCFSTLMTTYRLWSLPFPQQVLDIYSKSLGDTVNAIVIAAMVWACISHSTGFVGKILNSRVAVFVGTLSYSLYLWQQPFTDPARCSKSLLFCLPWSVFCSLIMALFSYYCIEVPFLNYKSRLTGTDAPAAVGADAVNNVQTGPVVDDSKSPEWISNRTDPPGIVLSEPEQTCLGATTRID